MSHSDIQSLKAEDLSIKELRLQKAQQAIDDLLMAANSDEFDDDELSEQELELVAGGKPEKRLEFVEIKVKDTNSHCPNWPPGRSPRW
jgi:hypothetical protein